MADYRETIEQRRDRPGRPPGRHRRALLRPSRRPAPRRSSRSSPSSTRSSCPASCTGATRRFSATSAARRTGRRSSARCRGGAQRQRDDVADLSRRDGARDGGARLDPPDDRPPGCDSRASSTTRRRSASCTRSPPRARALRRRRSRAGPRRPHRRRPILRVYASDQAHSSIEKAMIVLGLGERQRGPDPERRGVPAGRRGAARPRSRRTLRPGFDRWPSIATVGTTSTTSVDPVPRIAAVCRGQRRWLHVDAAYGGALALLPEGQLGDGRRGAGGLGRSSTRTSGCSSRSTSACCSCGAPSFCAPCSRCTPDYLRGDAARRRRRTTWTTAMQLGRRFRALKAWMAFSAFGQRRPRGAHPRTLPARAGVGAVGRGGPALRSRRARAHGGGLLSLRAGRTRRSGVRSAERADRRVDQRLRRGRT